MRRIAAVVLIAGIAVAVSPGRAWAHICPVAAQVPIGRTSTVTVAVTVESVPVPDIEIDVPPALRLDRVDPVKGWTFTRTGQIIRYHGPPFDPITCQYFAIGVTPVSKGAFVIPVIQRDAKGNVLSHTGLGENRLLDTVVYAGVKPHAAGASSGGGVSLVTVAGALLVVIGVAFAIVLAVRARRTRRAEEREDELQERVDAFRKQVRDRRPEEETTQP